MNKRIALFGALAVSMVAVLSLAFLRDLALERQTELRRAGFVLERALVESRVTLRAHVEELAHGPLWRSDHSLSDASTKRFLDGSLFAGRLDSLVVHTADCASLRTAALPSFPEYVCSQKTIAGTRFLQQAGRLLLQHISSISGAAEASFLQGSVEIGPRFFDLDEQVKTLRRSQTFTVTLQSEETSSKHPALAVEGMPVVLNFESEFIDRFLDQSLQTVIPFSWIFIAALIALVLAYTSWSVGARDIRLATRREEGMLHWARSLLPPEALRHQKLSDKDQLREVLALAIENKKDQLLKQERRVATLESRLVVQEEQLALARESSMPSAQRDALHWQVEKLVDVAMDAASQAKENGQDAADIIHHSLRNSCNRVKAIAGAWQEGVAERGARKFIRGLAETVGENGGALLEDQLAILIEACASLTNELQATYMRLSTMEEKLEQTFKIVSHWQGLVKPTVQAEASLLQVLSQAQAIFDLLYPEELDLKITSESPSVALPNAPFALWVCVFFHLLLAMRELGDKTSKLKVVIQNRAKQHQSLMVMRPALTAPNGDSFRQPRYVEIIGIIQSLLEPVQAELTHLPSTDDVFPLSLCWQAQEGPSTHDKSKSRRSVQAELGSATHDA